MRRAVHSSVSRAVPCGVSCAVLLILAGFVLLAGASLSFASGEQEDSFSTTTTHIELDSLGRLLKIEVSGPEPSTAAKPPSTEEEKRKAGFNGVMNYFGIFRMEKYGEAKPCGLKSMRASLIEIPFFRWTQTGKEGSMDRQHNHNINWYLFAFFDGAVEKQDTPNKLGGYSSYARVGFVDSPVFSGFKAEFEAPEHMYWEALDLPLSQTVSHETSDNENVWKVINVPLFWFFRYDHKGDTTKTHFVDATLASLYTEKNEGGRDDKWDFLDLPLISLLDGKSSEENRHYGALEMFKVGNGPFAAIYSVDRQTDKRGDGSSSAVTSRQFLRLPFIGPLVGGWSDREGLHISPLPNLFYSSSDRPEALAWF